MKRVQLLVQILSDEANRGTTVTGVQLPICPSRGDAVEIDGGQYYTVHYVIAGENGNQLICGPKPVNVLRPREFPEEGYVVQFVDEEGTTVPAFKNVMLDVQPHYGDLVNLDGHHYMVYNLQIASAGVTVVLRNIEVDIFGIPVRIESTPA